MLQQQFHQALISCRVPANNLATGHCFKRLWIAARSHEISNIRMRRKELYCQWICIETHHVFWDDAPR